MGVKAILREHFFFIYDMAIKLRDFYTLRKKRIINYELIIKTQRHYKDVYMELKKSNKKLRVASYVVFDSSFAGYELMKLMLIQQDKYEPKIVVIPDTSRGREHMIKQYNETKDFFIKKYGRNYVENGYDENTNEFLDLSDNFDIIYLANPYDSMVHEYHGIRYLSKKKVLPIYISYGCMPDKYSYHHIISLLEISLFWKVFADNIFSYKDYKKYSLNSAKNVVTIGYAKMDSLRYSNSKKQEKKTIVICPHHTINYEELPLSNFLEYKDFILELPDLYPNVDFVFRPHPLLFVNMVREGYWSKEDVQNYITTLREKNIEYSTGGDYFDIFLNSDGMIHDCSSFIVEYLYTLKPCCFVAKSNYKKILSKLGLACLKNYYLAFNREQIIEFIENVIIKGNDTLRYKRIRFTKKHLLLNYPKVSNRILEEIDL